MKVLVNGGLNLSELDGWWAEAYAPEVGWALGDGQEHGDDPAWDAIDVEALYSLLERDVVPEFYTRESNGIPAAWVARIRASMARLTPRFSASRAVREYTEDYYLPAAERYCERAADKVALGKKVVDWQHAVQNAWAALRFGEMKVETSGDHHAFELEVYCEGLDPNALRVELYANGVHGGRGHSAGDASRAAVGRFELRIRLCGKRVPRTVARRLHGPGHSIVSRRCGSAGSL